MSGTCFRGRGYGPRGTRAKVPGNGFSGPRFPHSNFVRPISSPNRLPGLENWSERPPGFPPWQANVKFSQRPQYRGNLQFRFNGRGRMPNGPGVHRFSGPGRPPMPQFPMGIRNNIRPRAPLPQEHVQEKPPLLPQIPLLGSEEERQQKITETADKLKQKLSSITEEELTHFWEDDFSILPNSNTDTELTQNKGIPELRHEPPELDLTFTDFRDIGRVDANELKLDNLDSANDEEDVIITFAGESTNNIESTNNEIIITEDCRKEPAQSSECINNNEISEVTTGVSKLNSCQGQKAHNSPDRSCNANKPNDDKAVTDLISTYSEDIDRNVLATSIDNSVIDSINTVHELHTHSSNLRPTTAPMSIREDQITLETNIQCTTDILHTEAQRNGDTIEEKLHHPQNTRQINNLEQQGCQTFPKTSILSQISSSNCTSSNEKIAHMSSNTLYVQSNVSHDVQSVTCLSHNDTVPSDGNRSLCEAQGFRSTPFNGAPRFPPRVHRWSFPQNDNSLLVRGPLRGSNSQNQLSPVRPNLCQSDSTPALFNPRTLPSFTHTVSTVSYDRPFHTLLPFSCNDLPPNFDPSEPPPNIRGVSFDLRNQTSSANTTSNKVDVFQAPPEFDPREPPPNIAISIGENLSYFNPHQPPPKIHRQADRFHSSLIFDRRQHSSQEQSDPSVHSSSTSPVLTSQNADVIINPITSAFSPSTRASMSDVQLSYQSVPSFVDNRQVTSREDQPPLPASINIVESGVSLPVSDMQGQTVNITEGLEDMQNAIEFANEAMHMNENTKQNDCVTAITFSELPVDEIPVPKDDTHTPRFPTLDCSRAAKTTKEIKSRTVEKDVTVGSESIVEKQRFVQKDQDKHHQGTALIDEQTRPKVMFNLNPKLKKINKHEEWQQQNDEAKERRQRMSQTTEHLPTGNANRSQAKKQEQKRNSINKNIHLQKERCSERDNAQRDDVVEASTSEKSNDTSHRNAHIEKSHSQSPSKVRGNSTSVQSLQKLRKQAKKVDGPTSETSWKDRVINRFLKMSKNDIYNMINNSSLRKFDIAMKHLLKEKRSSLSLEMRNTENEKMREYDRDEFMTQLNAMLDPGAVVDITNLPTEFIHHLNEVLQLDPMPFDTELCIPQDVDVNNLENVNQANTLEVHVTDSLMPEDLLNNPIVDCPQRKFIDLIMNEENNRRVESDEQQTINAILDLPDIDESQKMLCTSNIQRSEVNPMPAPSEKVELSSKKSKMHDTHSEAEMHKKPLFNTADLDDILSVVTEKTKQTSRSLSPRDAKRSTMDSHRTHSSSSRSKGESSTRKDTSPQTSHRGSFEHSVNSSAGTPRVRSSTNKTAESEHSRSRKSNSEDRYTFRRGKYERWSRKERENPDTFRNLTKEEWEAKYGRTNAKSSPFRDARRSGSNNSNSSFRRGYRNYHARRHYLSDSSTRHLSMSPVMRENTANNGKRNLNKYNGSEETHRREKSRSNDTSNTSSSSSDNEAETMASDVTKLLKVIKEKEKIAKNRSLNETIRDEVTAEIERKWREKDKYKERRNHKHDKRRKDRRERRRKMKKKRRRRDFESSTPESDSQKGEQRLLSRAEIKKEVIVKEEPIMVERSTCDNEITDVPCLSVLDNKTIALNQIIQDELGNSHVEEQQISGAPCNAVQDEIKSKGTNSSSVIQPKTKAQLKQMSEPSEILQKQIVERSNELSIDNENDGEKTRNEREREPVSEQADKDMSTNNNSLHQIDLPLNNVKLSVPGENANNESKQTAEFETATAPDDITAPDKSSCKNIPVPSNLNERDVSHGEKLVFTQNASIDATGDKQDATGNKRGSKKIDIKEYKERALQKWLKEQEIVEKSFVGNSIPPNQNLSDTALTVNERPEKSTELHNTISQTTSTDINTNNQRSMDPRLAKKEKLIISTSQETSTKKEEEKIRSDDRRPSTESERKSKDDSIRLRSIDELSDSRYKERNSVQSGNSQSSTRNSVKYSESRKRRVHEKSRSYGREKDSRRSKSSSESGRFKNIRSEGGKELKLKNERIKRSIERRRKSINQCKPLALSIKKIHPPKHFVTQKPLNQDSSTTRMLEPTRESTDATANRHTSTETQKLDYETNSKTLQTETLVPNESSSQIEITHSEESPNTVLNSTNEPQFNDDTAERIHVKVSENNRKVDPNENVTHIKPSNVNDSNDLSSIEQVTTHEEIDVSDKQILSDTRDEKNNISDNRQTKNTHVHLNDTLSRFTEETNEDVHKIVETSAVNVISTKIPSRVIEENVDQKSSEKNIILPIEGKELEKAKEIAFSSRKHTDGNVDAYDDIKNATEETQNLRSSTIVDKPSFTNPETEATITNNKNVADTEIKENGANNTESLIHETPQSISKECEKNDNKRKNSKEINDNSLDDILSSPFRGFSQESVVPNVYETFEGNVNTDVINGNQTVEGPVQREEMSFSQPYSWEKIHNSSQVIPTENSIRSTDNEIRIDPLRAVHCSIEDNKRKFVNKEIKNTQEKRTNYDEDLIISSGIAVKIKTRNINELMQKPENTIEGSETAENISLQVHTPRVERNCPEILDEEIESFAAANEYGTNNAELTKSLNIPEPEFEDCVARDANTYSDVNSPDLVSTSFLPLSTVSCENVRDDTDYTRHETRRNSQLSTSKETDLDFSTKGELSVHKDSWENIMTCLIPLSKSHSSSVTDTIPSTCFNSPGPLRRTIETRSESSVNRNSEVSTPFGTESENLPKDLQIRTEDQFPSKSTPEDISLKSRHTNQAHIEIRKTEQKNLHCNNRELEVRQNFESYTATKSGSNRAVMEKPKRLNIPTKAALKESVENLFIPPTYHHQLDKSSNRTHSYEKRDESVEGATSKSHKELPPNIKESEIHSTNDGNSKLNNHGGSEVSSHSFNTKKSSTNCTYQNPIVELEKFKDIDEALGRRQKTVDKIAVNVELESHRRPNKKQQENDHLHKTKGKQRMKHKQEKERIVPPEKLKEVVKSGIVQVGHLTSKEAIMARMLEIDVEIHKLMTEKMTLYQMLENDVFPTENNLQSGSTAHDSKKDDTPPIRPRTPSLMSQLIQNMDVSPVRSQSPMKATTDSSSSKNNVEDMQAGKQRTPSKHEYVSRKRNVSSYCSEDEETSENTKSAVGKRRKKQKTERSLRWEINLESSNVVQEVFVQKKPGKDTTKSILKKSDSKQVVAEQSPVRVSTLDSIPCEGTGLNTSSVLLEKRGDVNNPDVKSVQESESHTTISERPERKELSSIKVNNNANDIQPPNKLDETDDDGTEPCNCVKEANDTTEINNVSSEVALIKLQRKNTKNESVIQREDGIRDKEVEMLNAEETENLVQKLPENKSLEKLAIYSDDSTWESFLQNSTLETNDQRKPNTGLALLEETYKKEIAKSRKLKAEARKKKKRQLEHLLQTVNTLTPEEEELPLSMLYIKKLQQKRDLLDSLDHSEEPNDPKASQNVSEVISSVTENRVHNFPVDELDDQCNNDNHVQLVETSDVSPTRLASKDQLNNNAENNVNIQLPRKTEEVETFVSSPENVHESCLESIINDDDEVPCDVTNDTDNCSCEQPLSSMKLPVEDMTEYRGNDNKPKEEKEVPQNNAELSSAQNCVTANSYDSLSKIKSNVSQFSEPNNITHDDKEVPGEPVQEQETKTDTVVSPTTISSLEITCSKQDTTKGKSQKEVSGNQKNVSQNTQQLLSTSATCEKKEEKTRVGTSLCKSREKAAMKCIRDENIADSTTGKSNLEAKELDRERTNASTATVTQEKTLKRELHNQRANVKNTTEKLDHVPKVECSASVKEIKSGTQRTRKETEQSKESLSEEENNQSHLSSSSTAENVNILNNEDFLSKKLHKRKRGNGRASIRRSTRYTEESTRRTRVENDGNLASKDHEFPERNSQQCLRNKSPTPLPAHDEAVEIISTTTGKRNSYKTQTNRKRPTHFDFQPSSIVDESNANDDVEHRPTCSSNITLLCNDSKQTMKKRKLSSTLQIVDCEVKLVDSRYTILRPDASPELLRKHGISCINQVVCPKNQVDVTATNICQSISEDVLILNPKQPVPTNEDALEKVPKSIKRTEDTIKPWNEQNNSIRTKSTQKIQKPNTSGCERQEPKSDDEVLPILIREPITESSQKDSEKSDIEIVEERTSSNVNQQHHDDAEPELSIIGADADKEISRTQYTVHKGPILDIKVFGNSFLAASEDSTIYRYSQASNGILNIYKGHKAAVTCLYVYSTGFADIAKEWMFSGSLDGTLRCYNVTTGKQIREAADIGSPVQCMDQAWGVIFIGTKSGHVSRYHIKSGAIRGDSIEFSEKSVLALKATNEGARRVLIVASRNQPIMIRDAQTGLFLRTICGHRSHTVYSLMRDHNLIYCGTSSTSIPVFDFTNGEQTMQYDAGVGIVCMRLYHRFLFAGCYDGNIYVFDTKDHRLICSIPGPGNMLLSMEIVDDKIIAGSKDKRLQSWQMPKQVRALQQKIT